MDCASWLLSVGGTEGGAGAFGHSLPQVLFPCFHLLQAGWRMEITLELSRSVLGGKKRSRSEQLF